jgi:hypothetical protein
MSWNSKTNISAQSRRKEMKNNEKQIYDIEQQIKLQKKMKGGNYKVRISQLVKKKIKLLQSNTGTEPKEKNK